MRGLTLAAFFCAALFVNSELFAQDCCCQPVRNTVRAVVTTPIAIVNQVRPVRRAVCFVDRVRPVRRAVCWMDCNRPVRKFFGRMRCCCK